MPFSIDYHLKYTLCNNRLHRFHDFGEISNCACTTSIFANDHDFCGAYFPLHGVRVLTAWLFGGWSILYLFIANCVMHFVLTPDAEFTLKSFYAWCLVSSVAWFSFEIVRMTGINLYRHANIISTNTWRQLMLIAFISSIINSLGHNIIFAGDILPENSLPTMLAFMIGDTLGTFFCFLALMFSLRILRRFGN